MYRGDRNCLRKSRSTRTSCVEEVEPRVLLTGNATVFLEHEIRTQGQPIVAEAIYSVDMNLDGLLDVLMKSSNGIHWIKNEHVHGSAEFAIQTSISNQYVDKLLVYDLDNDSDLDVLYVQDHGELGWFENAGEHGGFVKSAEFRSENPIGDSIVATDLDSNGMTDLLVAQKDGAFLWVEWDNQTRASYLE